MLESLLMQITGTDIQAFIQSIVALTTAVVAIGAVIAKFIQTHSNNQKTKKWADIISSDLNATKQSLQATDHWVLENQAAFTTGMTVINGILTPEQQKALAAQGVNLDNLKKQLDEVTQELTKIYSTTPAEKAVGPTPSL